jgi:hypothetical protein
MGAALGLLRGSSEQISSAQRQRLMHSAADCLTHILGVSNCDAEGVLFEALTRLTPLPVAQAFLAAWRHESDTYGTLPSSTKTAWREWSRSRFRSQPVLLPHTRRISKGRVCCHPRALQNRRGSPRET